MEIHIINGSNFPIHCQKNKWNSGPQRYLYFDYCMQVLRRAWQQPQIDSVTVQLLMHEMGKPFQGSVGRYMPRNMLKGLLVEELGHGYKVEQHFPCCFLPSLWLGRERLPPEVAGVNAKMSHTCVRALVFWPYTDIKCRVTGPESIIYFKIRYNVIASMIQISRDCTYHDVWHQSSSTSTS